MNSALPRGVIAAGHPATADAGAELLRGGGNAADAAVAALFTACVAEPLFTSLGSGGFALVHDAATGAQRLLDFFVAMPGRGGAVPHDVAALQPVDIDYGGASQRFHAGAAAVGVPGMVPGLLELHRRFGRADLSDVLAPAIAAARGGVAQTPQQARHNNIISPILRLTAESARSYEPEGRPVHSGERRHLPELAAVLEQLASEGAALFTEGDVATSLLETMRAQGGMLQHDDLTAYEVIDRTPLRVQYRGREVVTNPPPSSGGALVALGLQLLERSGEILPTADDVAMAQRFAAVLTEVAAARVARVDKHLRDDDAIDRILGASFVHDDAQRLLNRLGNTTHISVLDAEGNAVSTTSSTGSCAGVVIPGTGIQLNNILGEMDLNPGGFGRVAPGARLTSMMAPTLVLENGRVALALGSAGSARIRSAIIEVISRLVDAGASLQDALDAPRLHVDGGLVEIEGGWPPEVASALRRAGHQVSEFEGRNLYFGGVQAVAAAAGGLSGGGDPRRGGVAIVV